jgi:hypothetical protein
MLATNEEGPSFMCQRSSRENFVPSAGWNIPFKLDGNLHKQDVNTKGCSEHMIRPRAIHNTQGEETNSLPENWDNDIT